MDSLPLDVLRLLGKHLGLVALLRLCLTCRALQQALPALAPAACALGAEEGEGAAVLLRGQGRRLAGLRTLRLLGVPCPSPLLRAAAALPALTALHLVAAAAPSGAGGPLTLTHSASAALCALPALCTLVLEGYALALPLTAPAPAFAPTLRELTFAGGATIPECWFFALGAGAFAQLCSFSGPLHAEHFSLLATCPHLTALTLVNARVCYLRSAQGAWKAILARLRHLSFLGCDFSLRSHLVGTTAHPLYDALGHAPALQHLCIRPSLLPASTLTPLALFEPPAAIDLAWLRALSSVWPQGLLSLELAPISPCAGFFELLARQCRGLHTLALTSPGPAWGVEAVAGGLPLLRSLTLRLRGGGTEALLEGLALRPLKNLTDLCVWGGGGSGAGLSAAALTTLAALPRACPRLKRLAVSHPGLRAFARASSPPPPLQAGPAAAAEAAAPPNPTPCTLCGALTAQQDAADHAHACPLRPRHCMLGCGELLASAQAAADHALGRGSCALATFQCAGSDWGRGLRFPSPAQMLAALQGSAAEAEAAAMGVAVAHCPLRWMGCPFSAAGAGAGEAQGVGRPSLPPPRVRAALHVSQGQCAFAHFACLGCGADTGRARAVAQCGREDCSARTRMRSAMPHIEGERRQEEGELRERTEGAEGK